MRLRMKNAPGALRKRAALAIIFLALALAISLSAEETNVLTLERAIQVALEQNRDILIARKNVDSAAGKTLQMRAVSDPTLVFRDEGLSSRAQSPGEGKELSLGIEQNLEFPGKVSLRGKIGREGEEQASLQVEKLRLLVTARVKKAYYRTVYAERTIQSLQESDALLDRFIKDLEVKYQAGAADYVDILRAKVEKARLHNRLFEEEKEESAARVALNTLLGRRGDEALHLQAEMNYAAMERSLSEVVETARRSSPTLRILASKHRQAELGIDLSKLGRWPDFSVGVYYPSLRTGSWGISLGLSLPLWRARREGAAIQARAENEAAIISTESEERRLESRIESAFAAVKSAESQVQVFEKTLLKDMEDELAMGMSRYQFGKIEFFNLLDLYRTNSAARLEHLNAIYNYLISLADLEIAGEDQNETEAS